MRLFGNRQKERTAPGVGLHVPKVIDQVWESPDKREIVLVMIQQTPWSPDGRELNNLAAKVDLYLAYIETGQLLKDYPDAASKRARIELTAPTAPPPFLAGKIAQFQDVTASMGVEFRLRVLGAAVGPTASHP